MRARTQRTAGTLESRTLVRLGRLLAAGAPPGDVEAEIAALGSSAPVATRALALEAMAKAGRWADVSVALEAWGTRGESPVERSMGALASAIVAERAGETARAAQAFRAVRTADPRSEGALRALAVLERMEQSDLVAELNALADELGDGVGAALIRIEAVSRGEGALPDPTRAALLERAYKAAPSLPIAPF